MSDTNLQAEWYYVGHYGQLGPLTLEQMKELATDGVITQETYVWRSGMSDWSHAESVGDLKSVLGLTGLAPPAFPNLPPPTPVGPHAVSPAMGQGYGSYSAAPAPSGWQYIQAHAPKSDKNKITAGLLNLLLPGVGRLYLGYMAHGVLQIFVTVMTCGVGILWPIIDGIYILAGGVKLDGYGRRLED